MTNPNSKKAELFAAAVTTPTRKILKVDRILDGLDADTADTIRGFMADPNVAVLRVVAGFEAIGEHISASSVNIWRKRNV